MRFSKFAAIIVVCLIFAQPIILNAQESQSVPKRTPRMTNGYSTGSTPKSTPLEEADWVRYSPGNHALSLELPGELQQLITRPPENFQQAFKEMEGYTCNSGQLVAMVIYYSLKKPQVS